MDDANPYARLAAAVVLPPAASAITNEWEPRNPEPMLLFLEAWAELLPPALLRHILDSLIFPKVWHQWWDGITSRPAVLIQTDCLFEHSVSTICSIWAIAFLLHVCRSGCQQP